MLDCFGKKQQKNKTQKTTKNKTYNTYCECFCFMVSGTTCVFCFVCFFFSVPVTSVGRRWWRVAGQGKRQPEPPGPGRAGWAEAAAARREAWGTHDKLVRQVSEELLPFIGARISVSPLSLRLFFLRLREVEAGAGGRLGNSQRSSLGDGCCSLSGDSAGELQQQRLPA